MGYLYRPLSCLCLEVLDGVFVYIYMQEEVLDGAFVYIYMQEEVLDGVFVQAFVLSLPPLGATSSASSTPTPMTSRAMSSAQNSTR
jgi:hypothetical protein